ncbi:SPFH domain-containing protein [Dactylosporangium darangshiense]|uniref:DUF3592 domain-containing protein n=1 Tax=Dactylosporangium darangshiense TaxID=579108 RepID=A0ABP8DSL1_9ACTN
MVLWFGVGLLAWLLLRFVVRGFYTVGPNERAVITTFGRARRLGTATTLDDPITQSLSPEEADRYVYPQVRVVHPGVHRKWPWQTVHKASIATVIVSIAFDPDDLRPTTAAPCSTR